MSFLTPEFEGTLESVPNDEPMLDALATGEALPARGAGPGRARDFEARSVHAG